MNTRFVHVKHHSRSIGKLCMHCGCPVTVTAIRIQDKKFRLPVAYCLEHAIARGVVDEEPQLAEVEEHERWLMTESADHLYERVGYLGGYKVVANNTVNPDRLRSLEKVQLDETGTRKLVRQLCRRFKMKMPTIAHSTRRSNQSGYYTPWDRTVTVGPRPTAEVVTHEVVHHFQSINDLVRDTYTAKLDRYGREGQWESRWHTKDGFVPLLDRFAVVACELLDCEPEVAS